MTPIATAKVFEALYRHDAAKIALAIQRGLDPLMCNEDEATLFHEAAFVGAAPIVAALLAAGADPNGFQREGSEELPLNCAILCRSVAAKEAKQVESLDDLSAVDRVAWSAAQGNALATIEVLIKAGANPNARGANGKTPLMVAIEERQPDLVSRLLELGADPTARSEDRVTVVQLARAAKSHPEILDAVQARLPAQLDLLGGVDPAPAAEAKRSKPRV